MAVSLAELYDVRLTLNLLTTTIVARPSNASKWQMGFNSAFKGLIHTACHVLNVGGSFAPKTGYRSLHYLLSLCHPIKRNVNT